MMTNIEIEKIANRSVPLIEKGNFCRYFATMIRSGMPILEAVDSLSFETQSKTLSAILREVKNDLGKGKTLGESIERFPKVFDPVFLVVISAGEKSGTLERSLEYLGKQVISDYYLLQRVKGAMLYPLVIIVTMVVIGFLMMGFVLPRIAKVFLTSKLPIPAFTRFIFEISLFVERYLPFIVIGFMAAVLGLIFFFTKGKGRNMINNLLPKLPLVKKIFLDLDIARFGMVLGTLLGSGVPIVQSVKIAASSLTLPQYAKLGSVLELGIAKGASISDTLRKQETAFPKMVTGMIAIGEKTGTLEEVFFDIANFYDQEVDNSLKSFTTILEPLLMIIVGIGVAFMVLSIITPIYSIVGSLNVN